MQHMKRWGAIAALLLSALAAALAPLFARTSDTAAAKDFPGWPTHYEGRALTELPLTQRELAFVHDFPGRVGRFSDGRREIIIRWVGAPTHAAGAAMGCFRARHGADSMTVCELIRDQRGASWPDVSAWYWNGMLGTSPAPWWSFVVAERE